MPLPDNLQQYEAIIEGCQNLKQFLTWYQNRRLDKMKILTFKNWMGGAKITDEQRPAAEALLAMAEKAQNESKPSTPRPTTGAPPPSQSGRKGGLQKGQSVGTKTLPDSAREALRMQKEQPISSNKGAFKPSIYGEPFHNPYTFIPFPDHEPERHEPTLLSMDEIKTDRMTGVMDITIKTCSPLLSAEDKVINDDQDKRQQGIQTRKARRIGQNYFVPATSMRGVLRTLTGIISGSALDYIDDNLWLCQGRDVRLGTEGRKLYLAKIVKKGTAFEDGKALFGEAKLVKDSALGIDDYSRIAFIDGTKELWIDNPDSDHPDMVYEYDSNHPYRVKISGPKVDNKRNAKGKDEPHEGAFKQEEALKEAQTIILPSKLWLDYLGRNRHAGKGGKKSLEEGDLIWLEANTPDGIIENGDHVKSIQWARWGREGVNFKETLKEHDYGYMWPDSDSERKDNKKVDITSDLFGSVPLSDNAYNAFAGRVRPDNLVFENDTGVTHCDMAPLSSPHPGCIAFYMDNEDYDEISLEDRPKGYKVYRTTKERGKDVEPWQYSVQPIFKNKDEIVPFERQKIACRAELIKEGAIGHFKLSYRSLTKKEFALLLLVLSCDLRIGGGKPFGLGHAEVTQVDAYDENGDNILSFTPDKKATLPTDYAKDIPTEWIDRASDYCKTQLPVEKLRYPRTINGNKRGGMCWFALHASVKKNTKKQNDKEVEEKKLRGLETKWISSNPEHAKLRELRQKGFDQIQAQGLPKFEPLDPSCDMLFGYDVGFRFEKTENRNEMKDFKLDEFEDKSFKPYKNDSQNHQTRQQNHFKRH